MGNCSSQTSQSFFQPHDNTLVLGRKYQNVLVQITKGKYFQEHVDILVIPLKSKDIQQNNQDVKEIMNQVGTKVKNEFTVNEFDEDNILITQGGKLNCSRILFILDKSEKQTRQQDLSDPENTLIQLTIGGTPIKQSIYTIMKKSLIRAKKINALSIAFPQIKERNFQTQEIATIMLSTIKEFLEEETDKGLLQTISISLEDDDTINTFKWTINRFFQKRLSNMYPTVGSGSGSSYNIVKQQAMSETAVSYQLGNIDEQDFDENL